MTESSTVDVRRAFAARIAPEHAELREAFARVPREDFLFEGPWQVIMLAGEALETTYTADASPEHVYMDAPIVLVPDKQLTNGQPSAHVKWLAALAPRPGERVLHVGCGTGFYSAILAELVGPTGRVDAREIEPHLLAAARANLAAWPQVTVQEGSSAVTPDSYDAVYVNAGTTHVPAVWLDAVVPGGRIVIPLTAHMAPFPHGIGAMLRIERPAEPHARWPAAMISPVGIYDCAIARDPAVEPQILRALPRTDLAALALERAPHAPGATCVVHVDGSCIQRG